MGYPRFSVPRAKPARAGDAPPSWWHWVFGILGGFSAGVVLTYFLVGPVDPSIDEGGAQQSDQHPAVQREADVVDDADLPESDGLASVSGDSGARPAPCPGDMIAFEAAAVKIHQPFPRKSWPEGPETLDPINVGPFCLDREPVLVSDYELCAAKGGCRPRGNCLEQPSGYPVNCVTWEEADAYCRWRGATLPTVVQWERTLLHGGKVRAEPTRGTWEWTADPFPASVFKRGEARKNADGTVWGYMALQKLFVPSKGGNRMCSWHKSPADASRGNLSFRCAKALDPRE